jgi:tartrate/fumarate subfamily iron-sulfur-dependent hydro-lyase alpha chain
MSLTDMQGLNPQFPIQERHLQHALPFDAKFTPELDWDRNLAAPQLPNDLRCSLLRFHSPLLCWREVTGAWILHNYIGRCKPRGEMPRRDTVFFTSGASRTACRSENWGRMIMDEFRDSILILITETSTNLPPDVRRAMARAVETETGERSAQALGVITTNIAMACENVGPICQDTGWLTFEVRTPVGANQIILKRLIQEAVVEATKRGKLRENSVDSLTGTNSGDNLGPGSPTIHFEQWERDEIEVKLLLKGGGCENKNIQYSLPMEVPHLGRAGRDLDGVRKCLLHAVWQAQGQGCSTGAIGVCIGGDRSSGYLHAKEQ